MAHFGARKILTCLSLLLVSEAAIAGNLSDQTTDAPVEAAADDPLPYWEGPYVGATLGYNFGTRDRVGINRADGRQYSVGVFNNDGWSGSLRVGYRWKLGAWVLGPELAVEGGQVGDDFITRGDGITLGGTYTASTKLNYAYSLRLKAGYVVPVLGTYAYGTIGVARASFDYGVASSGVNIAPTRFDNNYTANGYILGLGVEKPLTRRLSVTGEYEYTNYGKNSLTDGFGNTTLATPLFHNFKVGINLRF